MQSKNIQDACGNVSENFFSKILSDVFTSIFCDICSQFFCYSLS